MCAKPGRHDKFCEKVAMALYSRPNQYLAHIATLEGGWLRFTSVQ